MKAEFTTRCKLHLKNHKNTVFKKIIVGRGFVLKLVKNVFIYATSIYESRVHNTEVLALVVDKKAKVEYN